MRGDRLGGLFLPGSVLQETWTWSYSKGSFVCVVGGEVKQESNRIWFT